MVIHLFQLYLLFEYYSCIYFFKKYVILSNESSANEPNVKGTKINHQYSKTVEFENDFRNYEMEYIKVMLNTLAY